ncbi:MAG: hypothetical protein ACOYOK_07495 [Pseudobdellovibrionaceae bacterium]
MSLITITVIDHYSLNNAALQLKKLKQFYLLPDGLLVLLVKRSFMFGLRLILILMHFVVISCSVKNSIEFKNPQNESSSPAVETPVNSIKNENIGSTNGGASWQQTASLKKVSYSIGNTVPTIQYTTANGYKVKLNIIGSSF